MSDLGRRTWTELAADPPTLLLVPLGSTEQHGPHLPLDTDTRIAVAWAEALAEACPGAVVAPAVPLGSSGEHEGFPGTLSIGQAALELLVVELVRSAARWVDRVVLVCGHGGNVEPVRRAVEQLGAEGHQVQALFPRLAGDAHAGRTETSLLLHLAPELVRTERAEAGCTAPVSELMDALRGGGLAAVTANGVLGDPAGASAEEGRALLDQLRARNLGDGPALLRSAPSERHQGESTDEDAGRGAVGPEPGLEDRRGRAGPAQGG